MRNLNLITLFVVLTGCVAFQGHTLTPSKAVNSPIRVAVIDTGLNPEYIEKAHLCPTGHKDFTGEGFNDYNGHGSNVTGLIVENAPGNHYCLIIIKAYAFKYFEREYLIDALQYAYDLKVDIINLSSGGRLPNEPEKKIVQKILDNHIILIAAAGNNSKNLDEKCEFFPACYDDRIHVVGDEESYANKGKIVDSLISGRFKSAFGKTFSGTSQSTAIFTGKFLNRLEILRKKK